MKKKIYYTEYPTGQFEASCDKTARKKSRAKFIYKESETENGLPFIIVRNEAVRNPEDYILDK